jgi:ribulose-phosphate 3-epimerase
LSYNPGFNDNLDETMRTIIAPSILACDLARLGESVKAAEKAGADWHHLDIMDGHFVPNLTFGPDIARAVKSASPLPADVHLMIEEPGRYAAPFIKAGADLITFHIEVLPDPRPLVREIHRLGAKAGLVVKPKTPVDAVFPFLGEIDIVLIMTVEPGFTAQKFMPECVDKIAALRREAGPEFDIEVDGGINAETAAITARAGANVVVAGAAVYRTPDLAAAIRGIRESMERHLSDAGKGP